jgi:hypothetical protein
VAPLVEALVAAVAPVQPGAECVAEDPRVVVAAHQAGAEVPDCPGAGSLAVRTLVGFGRPVHLFETDWSFQAGNGLWRSDW